MTNYSSGPDGANLTFVEISGNCPGRSRWAGILPAASPGFQPRRSLDKNEMRPSRRAVGEPQDLPLNLPSLIIKQRPEVRASRRS